MHHTAATQQEVAKAPDPAPENKVNVAEPTPSTEAPAPTVDTPTNVAVTPRPTPVGSAPASTDVGSGGVGGGSRGGGLGGIGEAIGTIIGVAVIRGGGGGIDHCDPRTEGRGRGGTVVIPDSRVPIVRGLPTGEPVSAPPDVPLIRTRTVLPRHDEGPGDFSPGPSCIALRLYVIAAITVVGAPGAPDRPAVP